MQIHNLKIKHEYLLEVAKGNKTFELRKNDRDYQVGDLIRFIDINPPKKPPKLKRLALFLFIKQPTINFNDLYQVTYVLKDVPQYGLDADYCILGIKKLKLEEV